MRNKLTKKKKNTITRENKVLWPLEDFAQTPRRNVVSQLSVEEKTGRKTNVGGGRVGR